MGFPGLVGYFIAFCYNNYLLTNWGFLKVLRLYIYLLANFTYLKMICFESFLTLFNTFFEIYLMPIVFQSTSITLI